METRREWFRIITGEATQAEIAQALGVNHTTVSAWMADGLTADWAVKIARHYGADVIESLLTLKLVSQEEVDRYVGKAHAAQAPIVDVLREVIERLEKI